jgi:hypothetical protein
MIDGGEMLSNWFAAPDIAGDDFFANITYVLNTVDTTLGATARLLLYPRLAPDQRCHVQWCENTSSTLEPTAKITEENSADSLYILSLGYGVSLEPIRKALQELFGGLGYTRLKDIEFFVAQSHKLPAILVYTKPEWRSTVICFQPSSESGESVAMTIHSIQALLPRLLPWYFEDKPLTPLELELVHAVRKTKEDYLNAVDALIKEYGREDQRQLKCVEGFFERTYADPKTLAANIEILQEQIAMLERRLISTTSQLANLTDTYTNRDKRSVGVAAREFIDYLNTNPAIEIIEVSSCQIHFVVKTTFEFFDYELLRTLIDDPQSYYNNHRTVIQYPALTKTLERIFDTRDLSLQAHSEWVLKVDETKGLELEAVTECSTPANYISNPHLKKFGCVGTYLKYLTAACERGDMIGLVSYCIAITQSLNFADAMVIQHLLTYIANAYYCTVLKTPDGMLISFAQAEQELEGGELDTTV